jgi:hypothetical protein
MNGAFVIFKPEPVSMARPSPELAARLQALRDEFHQRSQALIRKAPHIFRPLPKKR